jgi:HK97 family phage portal protein
MGLRNIIRNLGALSKEPALVRSDFTPGSTPDWVIEIITGGGSNGGVSGAMNVPGLNKPAENVLMVYGCITARREAIGKVPYRISDPDGNLVESGPLINLFKNPRRGLSWNQYVKQLETYSTLYNVIAIAKVGDQSVPDELVPLSPAYLTPLLGVHAPTATPIVMEYRYNDPWTGAQKTYQPDELLIYQGFNPHAPLEALSPLNVLRRTMQADIVAREQNLALFQNDSRPAGILSNKQPMTKDQAEEVLSFWESRMKGYKNRNRLMATWGGLEYQNVGLTPAEMEYINGLKFLRTDYYIVFRVPPAMIYEMMPVEMGKGNEATDSQKVQWWEDVGLSELDLIASLHQPIVDTYFNQGKIGRSFRQLTRSQQESYHRFVNRSLIRGENVADGYSIWFDENAIPALVKQRLAKVDQMGKVCSLGYLPNDVNDWLDLGLPPHPDNLGRVAFNMQTIGGTDGSAGPLRSEASAGQGDLALPKTAEPEAPILPKKSDTGENILRAFDQVEKLCRAEIPAKYKSLIQNWDKVRQVLEKAAAKKYSRFFVEQRGRVLDKFAAGTGETISRADSVGGPDSAEMLKNIFNLGDENRLIVERIGPAIISSMEMVWNTAMGEMASGKANPFTVEDPRVMEAIKARKIQATKINETTNEDLRGIIRKSFAEGATTRQLGDSIAEYYKNNAVGENSARPMTAAQTQTAGIINDGRMIAARSVGGLKKGWLQGSSNEPRPDHTAAMNEYMANPIPLDEKFVVGGVEMDAPGDADAPIEQTANCNCMAVFFAAKENQEE